MSCVKVKCVWCKTEKFEDEMIYIVALDEYFDRQQCIDAKYAAEIVRDGD